MATGKYLGKIVGASFGINDDRQFGLFVTLATEGGHVQTGYWCASIRPPDARYSVEDHEKSKVWVVDETLSLLRASRRGSVGNLAGTPIEATFADNLLTSWRVLTEVL